MKQKFKTRKSQETFERVLGVATELFVEKGFERVTMREISDKSELGLGALYYYFESKEEFVLRFYERINIGTIEAFRAEEWKGRKLHDLVSDFVRLKFERVAPYEDLMCVIVKEAIDPRSEINPLNRGSAHIMKMNTDLFNDIIDFTGAAKGVDKGDMARGLWMAQIGLLLFWLHDRSKNKQATDRAVSVLKQLLKWSARSQSIPGFKRVRNQILSIIPGQT